MLRLKNQWNDPTYRKDSCGSKEEVMEIIPRTDLAIEFLLKWNTMGPWVLTAISPSGEKIATTTFHDLVLMESWIREFNGARNLYFTINKTVGEFNSKPKKENIVEITAFQADLDPRIGEDFQSERIRILKRLQEFKPHPSIITDSGGGFQAFWLLEEPIILDGTESKAVEFEAYSIQLELLLGADSCHNCDRIFRLPGTINLPNEIKKKKGRSPALSSVIEWQGTKYPISIFTKAPTKIQQIVSYGVDQLPGGGEKVKISGNLTPIYLEDLPKKGINLPDHVKVLIVQGHDPDYPTKYPSRSEALWAVVCELVRGKADDEVIAGIILNKDNRISESVLDKKRPERYAAKQIQDAREEVEAPILRKLNSKHAVILDYQGKCRIISEVFELTLRRSRISFSTFQDFINRYLNLKVQIATDKDGMPIMKIAGKWWVEHPQRRQYETVVFSPGKEVTNSYNLWQGWVCEAIPGNCSLFLEHTKKNICNGNEEHFQFLIKWMARCVQQPDCTGEIAIVLRGEMGTGKGVFAKQFGSLFGRHFLQISDPKHLVGSFNSHLRDCILIFADEAFWAGDKKHESILKSLVTEENLTIEAKGIDLISSPNYTHIIMASNSNWVVPAGSNERRFLVLDVGEDKMQNKPYFAAIKEEMDNGGREALLHYLLSHDITQFEVREVPKTEALQDQKLLSMNPEEMWWFEKLEEGRLLKSHDIWEKEIQKMELQDDYVIYMTRVGIMRKSSATVLGKFLGRVCPGGMPRSYQRMALVKQTGHYGEEFTINRRVYFYELPSIELCRQHWDKHYGGPFKWNLVLERQEQRILSEEAFK